MAFHRLRIDVDDIPGRLGSIAAALGGLGANIIDIDVQSVVGRTSVDEIVVELTQPIDLPAMEHAVRAAGGSLTEILDVDEHDLRDRATSVLDAATWLVAVDGPSPARLGEAACRLVGAELGWVAPTDHVGTPVDLVRHVLDANAPAQTDMPVKRLPSAGGSTWWLGVPLDPTSVLVVIRRQTRFTFTETARVQALVRLYVASHRPRPSRVTLADGGTVELKDVSLDDLEALRRLHRRCSPGSVQRRYFSALPIPPERVLRALADVDGDRRLGLVATIGSEIVGVAHALPGVDGEVELAFLVEDAHQRRGIGSVLFDRLSQLLVERAVHHAYALTFADNEGMRRLMDRAASRTSSWDGGGVLRICARLVAADAPVD